MLADDHAVVRDGLRVLLRQSADIRVVGEAADGLEAVRLTEELKPDVVIMNITMRELNGVEAARLLRDKCPATRVVMLSPCTPTPSTCSARSRRAPRVLSSTVSRIS